MVMIDAQTVKGGQAGTTFHEAGGRGGYTRGAKCTIRIEILGLPLAVSVESAKPHDVRSARTQVSLWSANRLTRDRSAHAGATGALCDQWLYATVPCVINAADFRGEL